MDPQVLMHELTEKNININYIKISDREIYYLPNQLMVLTDP